MKKIYIILSGLFLLTIQLKAQSPNSLSYQGVARDVTGLVLSNQGIGLRFTIHQGSAGGTVVYQETQSATTNLLGLFTVAVGSGVPVSGTFATIAWGANTEYLQVEMDPTAFGGTSYLNMGTSQFLSVPYALSSGSGWNLTGNSSTNGTNYIGTTDANDLVLKAHNNEVIRIANTTKNVGIDNPTPDASAVLDINSSTQGLLIPRLATPPASPAQDLMYFNTTTGCFMFYTGSVWQAIVCPCPNNLPSPGTITSSTGSGNFCPGSLGVTYSVTPVSVATGYTWTVPTGAAITAGQGSNSIAVTEGTVAGNVTVYASNNCGTGPISTLAVTPITTNITGQPANAAVSCAGGSATFTVTATGGGLTYQWQVSTNGGSTWTNVTNGAPYSNATTSTLTITSPSSSLNSYKYQCIVTGTCSFTSSPATLTISSLQSVPITLNNTQSTATSSGLQVQVTINSSLYTADGEDASLDNVEFSTGPSGTGAPLYAWLESATTAAPPTSASTATVYWVNLGSATIAASGTLIIYMTFMPSAVMTSTTSFTGMAPQLSGTYAQFDNGLLVFPSFYDNFAGTSLATKWTNIGTSVLTLTVNNKLTCAGIINKNWYGIYTNTFSSALNNVAETYATVLAANGFCINTSGKNGNGINTGSNGVDAQFQSSPSDFMATGGSCTSAPTANTTAGGTSPVLNTPYIFSFYMLNTPFLQINYGTYTSLTGTGINVNAISPTSEVGLGISTPGTGTNCTTFQWFRIRSNPPNSILPTATSGTYGCY